MITLSKLHKYFNKGKENEIHVLNDISLTLPEKGIVAIFGRSGCGKTTLLNVIGALDSYHSGRVLEDGREITADIDAYRNRDIGYIFQNYNLLKDETCYDNVANALRLCGMREGEEMRERVKTALSFVDMAEYLSRTPDTLSGGQQQRIAIARAIVKNPRIILADEPTGNLDEINTVMVMDLLREISRDCLVILVTHEAELVDYYCDSVIELADGKVVGVRENRVTDGYTLRDKNTVYLGELEKTETESGAVTLSYYGAKPDQPIALKLVNYGGKVYLSVDSPSVQLLTPDSEIKLCDGVFERREVKEKRVAHIDMSRLPRIGGAHFGRLFTVKSAIASGYRSNFSGQRRGKKLLQRCLALFAAVIVMMTAIFGTSIGNVEKIRESYNHNVFYLLMTDETEQLLSASSTKSGIDASYLIQWYSPRNEWLYFNTGFFETFNNDGFSSNFSTHGVYLPASLVDTAPLLAGERELSEGEILLSSASADLLLEKSTLGYLEDYDDLIGLLTTGYGMLGEKVTIAGVVESQETAFYLEDAYLADRMFQSRNLNLVRASEAGLTVESGKIVYYSYYLNATAEEYPVGKTVKVLGRELTVSQNLSLGSYDEYLTSLGIKKESYDEYLVRRMREEYPELISDDGNYTSEYYEKHGLLYDGEYALWLTDYYAELRAYAEKQFFFDPTYESYYWLYKDIASPYYSTVNYDLFRVSCYLAERGELPRYSDLDGYEPKLNYGSDADYEEYKKFSANSHRSPTFVVSDRDYLSLVSAFGESDALIDPNQITDGKDDYYNYYTPVYAVLHSFNSEMTEEFLTSRVERADEGEPETLLTPQATFEEAYESERIEIVTGLVTMGVILAVMSVCMYFIMRSALMNRVREIGIFRAIGVSRRNLVYRFAVETAVLVSMTVLVGYLLSSGFILFCLSASRLVSEIFYYPVWLALAVLLALVVISTFCGLLPILRLTRKTPSAIIAKYDI